MLTFTIILSRAVKWDCVLQNLILGQFKSMFVCFALFLLKARCERRDFLQWAHLMVMFFCLVFLKKRDWLHKRIASHSAEKIQCNLCIISVNRASSQIA